MSRYLVIDGYNAMHKIKELDCRMDWSLEAARMLFIKMLKDFMAQKRTFNKIFVVFDSKEDLLGIRKHSYGNIEALFTTADRDADNVIVDILRKARASDNISVASDDNFVRNHTKVFGKEVLSVSELKDIIMLKKKGLESRIKGKELEGDKIRGINEELKRHWGLR